MRTLILSLIVLPVLPLGSTPGSVDAAALGGPVIIGGGDLPNHGDRVSGMNVEGWLYIEKAIAALNADVVAPGPFTVDIAALGPFQPPNCPPQCPQNTAGAAIGSVADVLGLTIQYVGDEAAMQDFFDDLAAGVVEPRIIWLAGCNTPNALCEPGAPGELQLILENAGALSAFVASGHALMAHGGTHPALAWVPTLLPDVSAGEGDCSAVGAHLTPEGTSVFPGLNDSDIDDNAGPCHGTFPIDVPGGFRGLRVLALDGMGNEPNFQVCVGGGNEGLDCADGTECPGGTCEPGGNFLIGGGPGTLITGCGNDLVDQPGEECDGTADAACPGQCLPLGMQKIGLKAGDVPGKAKIILKGRGRPLDLAAASYPLTRR